MAMTKRDINTLAQSEAQIAYLEMCITEELGRMDLVNAP